MSFFRKKPVLIEAFVFNPESKMHYEWKNLYLPVRGTSYDEIHKLIGTSGVSHNLTNWDRLGIIETLEGPHVVEPGDYVIKGIKGEYYPCKPDIFVQTYEPVE